MDRMSRLTGLCGLVVQGPALGAIDMSTRGLIEEQMVLAMCGKGDLLIIVQNADRGFGEPGMVSFASFHSF